MDTRDLAAWLNDRLDRLENKVDSVQSHCAQIDVTLTKQAADVEHHIKRTDLLEYRVEQVAASIRPISEWQTRIKAIGWLVGFIATAAGILETINRLIG